MATIYPTPTGAAPDKFVAAQTFWVITYYPSQNSVSSRYTGALQSNLTDIQTLIIAAPTSAQALKDAEAEIGTGGIGFSVSSVSYGSQQAAQQAAQQQTQTQQQQNQAGTIPNPFSGWSLVLGNTAGLLTRLLKILFGGALLVAGIIKLSGKQDIIVGAGKKIIEGALLA